MLEKQSTIVSNNRINPTATTDGRYGSCCDLMTAIGVGDIYHDVYALLDQTELHACEVVDKAAFILLLPTEDTI